MKYAPGSFDANNRLKIEEIKNIIILIMRVWEVNHPQTVAKSRIGELIATMG